MCNKRAKSIKGHFLEGIQPSQKYEQTNEEAEVTSYKQNIGLLSRTLKATDLKLEQIQQGGRLKRVVRLFGYISN